MANRLAAETSPYLRQHADNPVDWYPWGDEALALAKQTQRPILLSVGYSACHWCHVMAHESFEDPQVAALMNAHFVNIKVDREERPDVDHLYQGVVQLMGRGGGWPLTVFLTPDKQPVYGGTYFPPTPQHGLPAFSAVVAGIAEAWEKEREELLRQGEAFEKGLTQYAASGVDDAQPGALTPAEVVQAAQFLAKRVDPRFGGFGARGPKFPNPMLLALMLRGARRSGDEGLLTPALLTLERMALGGVFDQLGGGFHRYSVDERWLVPHFEKMLYDNAQLLHLYAEAMQVAPRPLWKKTVEETVAWLGRELTSPEGAFFAAQDADSEGEEGRFFVWREEELDAALTPDEAAAVKAHFGVKPGGNFEHGASVLEVVGGDEVREVLARAKQKLFDVRAQRVAPGTDDKVLAGWNGLAIRGLSLAARVFQRPEWSARARRAADFVLERMRKPDGGLWRSFHSGVARIDGQLEDYGDVCAGLVALYQATFEPRYLEAAEHLADLAVATFWSAEKRAWLAAPRHQHDLLVPTYSLHDNATPAGASTMTEALVALGALTGRARHLEQARVYLEQLHHELTSQPMSLGHLWLAADALLDGAPEVTLVGSREALEPFVRHVDETYLPTLAVHVLEQGAPVPAVAREVLSGRPPRGEVAAYLCRSFACQAPVSSLEAFRALVRPLGAPPAPRQA
ncbi:MAG: thioredoxin domain-containing protein [Myxococcus sp.]|nr:thioredoxin domain-containing protein [Myxococcus sp.]